MVLRFSSLRYGTYMVTKVFLNGGCASRHWYWNVSGGMSMAKTEVTFLNTLYLKVDDNQLPTGGIAQQPGVELHRPITFITERPIIDDFFVLDTEVSNVPIDTRSRPLRPYVVMHLHGTKIHLEAGTTKPSFQIYSGGWH
ncbi:hypothetical protein G7046_g2848 [Stylonectria norvegica]|nr:hypothetical protein G7046_g2848 [Stylonectria norvegica]